LVIIIIIINTRDPHFLSYSARIKGQPKLGIYFKRKISLMNVDQFFWTITV